MDAVLQHYLRDISRRTFTYTHEIEPVGIRAFLETCRSFIAEMGGQEMWAIETRAIELSSIA